MYVDANEAQRRLGIARQTLYAYVSRGLIRSRPQRGTRKREYSARDIETLLLRKGTRRDPSTAGRRALGVKGVPVLESSLCLIADGHLYYRGVDAIELAQNASLEQVAASLWGGALPRESDEDWPVDLQLPLVESMLVCLASMAVEDHGAYHLEPSSVRRSGARILRRLGAVGGRIARPRKSVCASLMAGWKPRVRGARARIESALVLCAEHGLNASAFTARCVASSGATPYMAVCAALAALSGKQHGGMTHGVAAMLDEAGTPRSIMAERLRRGDPLPGFGHPLYPSGDPRARLLLTLAADGPSKQRGEGFVDAGAELLGRPPTLDLGLVVLARSLRLPEPAPLCLFALGRIVGWIAHCIEQYASEGLIRPRARYVGPEPGV